MSKYTTEVRFICESLAGQTESTGFSDIDNIIENAREKIFSFDYPIFDEEYKSTLETKILRHYYTREIGLETYGLWKLKLQTRMNEIMPYYNKLYETELLKYNPLFDVDMTTTNVGKKEGIDTRVNNSDSLSTDSGTNDSTAISAKTDNRTNTFEGSRVTNNEEKGSDVNHANERSNRTNRDAYSDTPQGALTNVENNAYLTNFRKVEDDTGRASDSTNVNVNSQTGVSADSNTETSEGSANDTVQNTGTYSKDAQNKTNETSVGNNRTTEDYIVHTFGKSAGTNYAKLIKDFRDSLLNIDMDVIRDLENLFMLIW